MTTRDVVLEGGSPWGFRIQGGVDSRSPLRISRVNSSGKASLNGIREGDLITSINGHSTQNLTYTQAHALVKSSGNVLTLGITGDTGSSSRQRKHNKTTIHETHSETAKSTSSTLYSRTSSKTIFSDGNNEYNDPEQSFRKQPSIEGQNHSREYPDPPLSPNSTVSSDVSSCSTLTEAGTDPDSVPSNVDMADRANSKPKKKQSRHHRKKSKKTTQETNTTPNIPEVTQKDQTLKEKEEYKVDFPDTVQTNTKLKAKSRSLDDDESVEIQEVPESVEGDKHACEVIISEADSDWEETSSLKVPQKPISLSTVAISIDEDPLQRVENLSEEEELNLKNFLEGIHLVNAPETELTASTLDTIKTERARKQDALKQYFTPLVYNPRYLDIISEEGSDLSDRETTSLTHHLKQGTPELDSTSTNIVESTPRIIRRNKIKRMRLPRSGENAILVQTKIFDSPAIVEHFHSCTTTNAEAEKVFLESSSESVSSRNSSDSEEITSDVINEKDTKGDVTEDHSKDTDQTDVSNNEITEQSLSIEVKENDLLVDTPSQCEINSEITQSPLDENIVDTSAIQTVATPNFYDELTPPPTPEASPKNKLSSNNSLDLEDSLKALEVDAANQIVSVLCKVTVSCNPPVTVNHALSIPEHPSILSAPSRSPSRSSSSSSRETSPSTVRLNMMNSSIADVTSILPDLELAKAALSFKQPLSLRKICLQFLMSLPCGAEILQELSDTSVNLDRLTQANDYANNALESDATIRVSNDKETNNNNLITERSETMWSENWTGLPFKNNPNVLLYVSPAQQSLLEKSEPCRNQSEVLYDLHTKFVARTANKLKEHFENPVEVISMHKDKAKKSFSMTSNTLPRTQVCNPRLEASSLSEWLKFARKNTTCQDGNKIQEESKNETENLKTERRLSLPDDLYEHQMQYILEKEKEIEKELEQLLEEKRKLYLEIRDSGLREDTACLQTDKSRPKSFPPAPSETFRQQLYQEYMEQVIEREQRKQHKVLKITSCPQSNIREQNNPKLEAIHPTAIEDEFMKKVQELHGASKENEDVKNEEDPIDFIDVNEPVILMDGNNLKTTTSLPKHLREFVELTNNSSKTDSEDYSVDSTNGVWSPGQKQEFFPNDIKNHQRKNKDDEGIPSIWQPKSATSSPVAERKEFRPVSFESPKLSRRNNFEEVSYNSGKPTLTLPKKDPSQEHDAGTHVSATLERRLPNSRSSPAAGFHDFSTPRLPRAQNPTITLLQKAREGQLPRGANYLEPNRDHFNIPQPPGKQGEILHPRRNDYYSESDGEIGRRMENSRTIEGVGPMTRDGMPLSLRSEVRDSNQSKWYKKMYDTIHKQKPYKAQYPYITGYLSEPEQGAYDSDHMDYKYATLDRRRTPMNEKENFGTSTLPRNMPLKTSSSSDIVHHSLGAKLNPGRIENYIPGHSSISDQESKRNFEENRKPVTKGYMSQALKESGYESDSTLVFRRKEDSSRLSPSEQKEAYKVIQKGGDIPLHGLRKTVPEPLKGSPRKYVENQVTIHYKTPVRQEIKEYYSEDELAHRQQEAMKKIYQEERRRKYLQELQDMHNRRHTDNFIPSQKSPIALNRYDDFDDLIAPQHKIRPRSPEPRLVARALYNFVGMTPRELTFRKGDNIYVRRQIDKNWYEGELNAMVGLFPVNYVEIVPYENVRTTPRKPHEGQARAKYNFLAKTHLELSLAKGEMVIITRRVDNNWYEGKIGGRKGIFPASYVDILIDPQEINKESPKPVAAPAAHSLLLNGSSGRESMGSHTYTPHIPNQDPPAVPSYYAKPVQVNYCNGNRNAADTKFMSQALHIDTQSAEPTPFKALYKYLPQNDDELELMEGDTVYVLEKCDDGWFVGSNERTGAFGTFPGNYVDKA